MKENSIKKEQSSIEENIEILEKFKNNEMQRDKLERDGRCGGWKIGDIYKCLELDNAIGNILSDYKRVLKENDCLKNHVHYKNCIACGKEFRSKRNDARYCIKCSKQIANKNYIANLTEEQKLRRREQAKLAMRKLRANK